jgi:hypothetical protein
MPKSQKRVINDSDEENSSNKSTNAEKKLSAKAKGKLQAKKFVDDESEVVEEDSVNKKKKRKVVAPPSIGSSKEHAVGNDDGVLCYCGDNASFKQRKQDGVGFYNCANSKQKVGGKWDNGCKFFIWKKDLETMEVCGCGLPMKFQFWKKDNQQYFCVQNICENRSLSNGDSSDDEMSTDEEN